MKVNGTSISMTRGDSETITVSCEARPFVTGDILTFTVRKTVFEKKKIVKEVTEFTEEGKAIIEIKPEDTNGLGFGGYVYDIQLEDESGTVTTIIKPSRFVVEQEVTYNG